ncbi:MAG: helix-turn-helix domain-containing protein [Sneathiella sp.]
MIPNYALYGEEKDETFPDILHCESIAARSKKNNWVIAPHRHHNLHQFFLLKTGGGAISIEDTQHILKPPVVISIPPLTVHGFEFSKDTEGWVVTIPHTIMKEVLLHAPEIHSRLHIPIMTTSSDEVTSYFEKISDEHRHVELGRSQLLAHLAGTLTVLISRNSVDLHPIPRTQENKRQIHVQQFLNLLEKNFRCLHSVSEYSKLLDLSPTHLTRSCREITGKSTSDLIQDRLILEAKRSLVYTKMPISEVAYFLGFNDPAHFSKFFHRQIGVAPSRFREKADLPS